jgi:ethanolamine utilization microcompartment shell protein EutL
MNKLLTALALSTALAAGMTAPADAQQTRQEGLVNVNVGDVTLLENVAVGVAANVVAQICGVQVGQVAVLATQVIRTGQQTNPVCEARVGEQFGDIIIAPGDGRQPRGQTRQEGLVNVNVGDVTLLENVAVGVAANVIAQVCGVQVGQVAVLATQVIRTGQETNPVCEAQVGEQFGDIIIAPGAR